MSDRFFVAGCQRSGTTMLRLILDSHPRIKCYDETIAYDILTGGPRQCLSSGKASPDIAAYGFKIPRFSEQLTWKEFVDPDYGRFPSFYRDEKTLFIVRNVCDVVSSMITLRADAKQSWIERYGIQILEKTLAAKESGRGLLEKFKGLERKGFPIHLVGALYWEAKNHGMISMIRCGLPVMPICYERFVSSPHDHLLKMMKFLGLGWHADVLTHHQLQHEELDVNGLAIGNTDPKRAIDTLSIGRAIGVLQEDQRESIKEFVRATELQLRDNGIPYDL